MITLTSNNKMAALLSGIVFFNLSLFALGGEMKNADSTKPNRIEIKDFARCRLLSRSQRRGRRLHPVL